MAKTLHAAGCIAVVTDGGARDLHAFPSIPFAAYGTGKTIHHCPIHFRRTNQPINVGGITIRPGDLIHANAEGVIRIPGSCIEKLPERALAMRAFEQDAHRHLRRTDLTAGQKRDLVASLVGKYGFGATKKAVARKRSTVQL